jgi:hypoxanthine-DNA glycosylase
MPGEASLVAGQYYAHPKNQFWPILGAVLGFDPDHDYRQRLRHLRRHGIALWDVLHSCIRPGSADAMIERASVNEIAGFLEAHPAIGWILFNGSTAERYYRRHEPVVPRAIRMVRLPSTSPAMATVSQSEKMQAWRRALHAAGLLVEGHDSG